MVGLDSGFGQKEVGHVTWHVIGGLIFVGLSGSLSERHHTSVAKYTLFTNLFNPWLQDPVCMYVALQPSIIQ